jgi:hypothetical protein
VKEARVLNFDPAQVAHEAMANATVPADKHVPLLRDGGAATPYPVQATGPLRSAVEAIAVKTQAPIAIIANSLIAAAAVAVAPLFDAALLSGRTPLSVACLSIAASGERKTTVDALALAPIREMEAILAAGHDAKIATWLADVEARKSAVEHAKKSGKGDRAVIRASLETIGPESRRPPSPMIEMSDPTAEGIANFLIDHFLAVIFASEGGTFLGGHGMNDDSRLRMGAQVNSLWGGETVRRIRASTGALLLPGRRMVAHLMCQPAVAEILTNDPVLNDIGLMARLLIVAPNSTAGTRFYREPSASIDEILLEYGSKIKRLMRRKPKLLDGGNGLDPVVLPLHPDARRMLIAFHDYVETGLAPDGEFSTIRAFASKMGEHAGRLAGIMNVYDDPDLVEIGVSHMANGITLATYYASEMRRLADGATVSPELKLAKKLLEWWQARPDPRCYLGQIYQIGPNVLREAKTAKRIVAILEEHGWIKRLPFGTAIDGAPRRDCWEIVK